MRHTTNQRGYSLMMHPTTRAGSRAMVIAVIAIGLGFLCTAHASAQLVLSRSGVTLDGVEVGQSWQVAESLLRSSDSSVRIDVLDTADAGEVNLLVTHRVPRLLFPQDSQFSFGEIRVASYSVTVWLGKVIRIACEVIDSSANEASLSLDDARGLAVARHNVLQVNLRQAGYEIRPPFRKDADFRESENSPLGRTVAFRQLRGAHSLMVVDSRRSFQSFFIRIIDEAAYARISTVPPKKPYFNMTLPSPSR